MSQDKFYNESTFLQVEKRIKIIKNFDDDGEVASWIGMKTAAYSRRKKRGSVPSDLIEAACTKGNISPGYILRGDREPSGKIILQNESESPPPLSTPYRISARSFLVARLMDFAWRLMLSYVMGETSPFNPRSIIFLLYALTSSRIFLCTEDSGFAR